MQLKPFISLLCLLFFSAGINAEPVSAKSSSAQEEQFSKLVNQEIIITDSKAKLIGYKIWLNETGGKRKNLIVWNDGEDFVSLGIGHFIWFPETLSSPFEESFPQFIEFLEKKSITLPDWLNSHSDCPWKTKDEFLNSTHSRKMLELQKLLTDTVPQQVQYLMLRLKNALPKIFANLENKNLWPKVRRQFDRVAETQGGMYVLVDYVNFKGEGVSPTERYNGQGWGLLQVLLNMKNDSNDPLNEFANAADDLLTLRTKNAPKNRNERRWLPGWKKRLDTYRNIKE